MMTSRGATMIGFTAILMWSLLAVLTVASGTMPPFQVATLTFALGALVGALPLVRRGSRDSLAMLRRLTLVEWLHGVGGLFGYHALYFFALRYAPPAEAGLINYLWPLLIVVLSAFLPGETLRAHHLIGALMGFAGTVMMVAARGGLSFGVAYWPGLSAAFVAAFVWAIYSVLSRRLTRVPADAVAAFCAVTALLSWLCHLVLETTVWPTQASQWLALAALGLGPVGAAFYVWQIGMKAGDVRVLGAASYLAPLLSTGFLILAGYAEASGALALAALMIAGGGLLAARDMFARAS